MEGWGLQMATLSCPAGALPVIIPCLPMAPSTAQTKPQEERAAGSDNFTETFYSHFYKVEGPDDNTRQLKTCVLPLP